MDQISDTRNCMASLAIFKSLYDEKKDLYSVIASAPCGPIPQNMARPLMVRQPYSVVVPSTGGRLHLLVPEEREAW